MATPYKANNKKYYISVFLSHTEPKPSRILKPTMTKPIPPKSIHGVKKLLQTRLYKAVEKINTFEQEKKIIRECITNQIAQREQAESILIRLESVQPYPQEVLEQLTDELEIVEKFDWKYIALIQEKSMSLIQSIHEDIIELKSIAEEAQQLIQETKPYKPTSSESTTPHQTQALTAMEQAIQKYWINYDPNNIPTQKSVSNFIAEQLGKPIRDRFTDELARAIKPDHI